MVNLKARAEKAGLPVGLQRPLFQDNPNLLELRAERETIAFVLDGYNEKLADILDLANMVPGLIAEIEGRDQLIAKIRDDIFTQEDPYLCDPPGEKMRP